MKLKILLAILLFFTSFIFATVQPSLTKAKDYASKVSWAFEENKGQVTGADSSMVKYFYKAGGLTMFLLNEGIAYQFEKHHYPEGYPQAISKKNSLDHFQSLDSLTELIRRETYRMDIELVGANQNCEIITEGKSPDYIQYYNYNALDVHAYEKITYKNIYPNIDWVIYFDNLHAELDSASVTNETPFRQGRQNEGGLKYDFIVHPGGNPSDIKLKTHWTEETKINPDGSLTLSCSMGEIMENFPISFQGTTNIPTSFVNRGEHIQFQIGNYNQNQVLVIDPSIIWATYYGGGNLDYALSCITDAANNVYMCGRTYSTAGISNGGFQNSIGGGAQLDAFLVKFNSVGARLWATYYGGSGIDNGQSCITDIGNNVYLCGSTSSTSSISSGGFQNTLGGGTDAFLVKFNSSGSRLWATYYGGSSLDNGSSCIIDTVNNVYLSGSTSSTSGISSGGFQNTFGGGGNSDAYLVKFNSSGSRLWATYYGGNSPDGFSACIVDKSNNVYACGTTNSTSAISSGGFQNTLGGGTDAFLVKFNSAGSRVWATYYGGSGTDDGYNCITDSLNNVYICGRTSSTSGISSGGFQNGYGGGAYDGFLVRFNSSGSRLWATYYGGSGTDFSYSCAIDTANNVHLCGWTSSASGISGGGFQNSYGGGGGDGMLVRFNSTGSRLWSSYYGGALDDVGQYCAINAINNIYICGITSSSGISKGGFQNSNGGNWDCFLVKISDSVIPQITINKNTLDSICFGSPVLFFDTIMYGGMSPKFKWYKNNVLVDTNVTYTSSNLNNGDRVYCMLTSNHPLRTTDTAWSNLIKIYVKPISNTTIYDTICSNQSIWFNGSIRTTSGAYLDTLVNSKGCDSFLSLNLFVKPISNKTIFDTTCSNQSYVFNGVNRTISGTYYDTLINAKGCDSFLTLELIVKSISINTIFDTVCSNISYVFNGLNRTTSGTYYDTLINTRGCDSFLTLNLVVKSTSSHTIYDTICSNQSKMFNGISRTIAGIYLDTLINSKGCDSFLTMHLIVKPTSSEIRYDSICPGQPILFNSQNVSAAGVYKDTLVNSKGCDSFLDMHLFVKISTTGVRYDTICHNHLIHFNGKNIGIAGSYFDTLVNSQGCDSFLTMNLSVRPPSNGIINQSICTGYTYFFNGIGRSVAGTYQDTLLNSRGCDSFLTLNLTVKSTDTFHIYPNKLCEPQSYWFNNQNIYTSGLYRDTFTSSQGCDSFIFLHLLVKDTSLHEFTYVTPCNVASYMFNGIPRTQPGRYTAIDTNALGCDSTTILNLFFRKPTHTRLSPVQICPSTSYVFDGIARTASGDYIRYYSNADGCPSTDSLRISILNNPTPLTNPISACAPFTFKGKTYTSSATVIDTIKNIVGNCDSVYIRNLIQLKPPAITAPEINNIVCDSIRLNNRLYTTSFSFIDTFRTVGIVCDSVYRKTNYTIRSTPQIGLKERDTFMRGSQVTLRPFSATNYLWSTGQTTKDISFKLIEDRQLYLVAWNEEPCRDTAYISLVAEDLVIVGMPTGFSPTGEYAENRTLRPNINGRLEYLHLMVFNRWGEKVYETFETQPLGWNGIFKGELAPSGLYGYVMEYRTLGLIYNKTGEVMLVW